MNIKAIFNISLYVLLLIGFTACEKDDDTPAEEYKTYENLIVLEGEDNFRDLGGFVGQDGKRVLYRKLFRSGGLDQLTEADKAIVISLGIKRVVDLRKPAEVEESPDNLPSGINPYFLPLFLEDDQSFGETEAEVMAKVLSGEIRAQDFIMSQYITIDDFKEASWRSFFDLLKDGKPILWHCSAGKDRTGQTAALVLAALGVDRTVIIDDFMASNEYLAAGINGTVAYLDATYGEGVGELLRPVLGVEEEYILAFFDTIDQQYGSMDAFLAKLGIDKEELQNIYLEK